VFYTAPSDPHRHQGGETFRVKYNLKSLRILARREPINPEA